MTFDQMQRMVLAGSGNLKSNHPLYKWVTGDAPSSTPSVINMAANRLIRMKPTSFPEFKTTWTIGPTIAGTNEYSVPSDMVVLFDIATTHSSSVPNWATDRAFPVEFIPLRRDFDLMTRDSSVSGYPSICCKKGKQVTLWPTPDATHICYIKGYGIMEETALVNAGDTFFMNPDYHPVVVRIATAMIAELRGSLDRAQGLLASAKTEVNEQGDLNALEDQAYAETMSVAWPFGGGKRG